MLRIQAVDHLVPVVADIVRGERSEGRGNLDHFCLVIDETDLEDVQASGRFAVVEGPGTRWGARGDGRSLDVRDPDGTAVELRHYGGTE